ADVRHLERSALHAPETDLAGEAAIVQEETEAVRGVEVALPLPRRAARTERLAVERGIGRAGLTARLPLLEPLTAPQPHLTPRRPVVGAQGAQQRTRADELHQVGTPRHRPRL